MKSPMNLRLRMGFAVAAFVLLTAVLGSFLAKDGPASAWRFGGHRAIQRVAATRGTIWSADGVPLAYSGPGWSLAVDPTRVEDVPSLAGALSSLGLADSVAFVQSLQRGRERRFVWVCRRLDPTRSDLVSLLVRYPCFLTRDEDRRVYALGTGGGATLGLAGVDNQGLAGLEAACDSVLRGRAGRALAIPGFGGGRMHVGSRIVLQAPVAGATVATTLDSRIQQIAARHLAETVVQQEAAGGFVIVTRPQTGEILAMASLPGPDPLDSRTWVPGALRVPAVTDVFEPGSLYNVVAFAAALENGSLSPQDLIDCLGGVRTLPGGCRILDREPHEVLTASGVLAQSSNVGTGIVAERVGGDAFYRMEQALGFGSRTGVMIHGEGNGTVPELARWSAASLAVMAFGQWVSCTGMQLAMAYGAIANGGLLMEPVLVREIRREGKVLERHQPTVVRRAMSPATARSLAALLRGVVSDGTGRKAEIPGCACAGKTGTAQKYLPEERGYGTNSYVASFIGFAPCDQPDLLCLVVIDEPQGSIYGGNVAAPVFKQIISDVRAVL